MHNGKKGPINYYIYKPTAFARLSAWISHIKLFLFAGVIKESDSERGGEGSFVYGKVRK